MPESRNLGLALRRIHLRVSVTDRCDLRCRYCRPARPGPPPPRAELADDEELLELVRAVDAAVPVAKLRITGGEPLLRPRLPELVRALRAALPQASLGITTNGVGLAGRAGALREAGIASLNVSVDTLDPATCHELTRGGRLAPILAGVRAAHDAGFPSLKLNTVMLRRRNGGELAKLVRMAASLDCEIRFIELMPFGEGAALHAREYLGAPEALSRLALVFPYEGRLADSPTARRHRFRVDGRSAVVGFITTLSDPFCAGCDRIRLDARGRLRACLREAEGVDLLGALRRGGRARVRELALRTIRAKALPEPRRWPRHSMAQVGG